MHMPTTTPLTHSPRRGHGPPRPECHTLSNCRHPTHITTSGSVAPSPTEDSAAGVWGRNQSGPHANPSPRDVTLTLGLRVTVRATGAEGSHRAALPTPQQTQQRAPEPAGSHTKVLHTEHKLGSGGWGKEPKEAWDCLGLERLTRSPPLRLPRECEEWKVHSKAKRDACHGREMRGKRAATRVYNYTANTLASTRARPSSTFYP